MKIGRFLEAADKFVKGYKVLKPNASNEEHVRALASLIVQNVREMDYDGLFKEDELEERIGYWTAKSICNEKFLGHYFSRLFFRKADNKFIGFMLGRTIKDRIPFANLDMLYFIPEARGNIINGRLVSVALGKIARWTLNKGIAYFTASCLYNDDKGFRRLSAFGMKPIEIRFFLNLEKELEKEFEKEAVKDEFSETFGNRPGTFEPRAGSGGWHPVSDESVERSEEISEGGEVACGERIGAGSGGQSGERSEGGKN